MVSGQFFNGVLDEVIISMHYYQFNIADYANSTQHLEPMEDLAYRRMLDLYYMKEKPLPSDVSEIARLIRMRTHSECIAIVLQDFFVESKDGYVNIAADENLQLIYGKSDKARKAALARWNKIKELEESKADADAMQTHSEGNADGMLPNTHYPLPIIKDYEQNDLLEQGFDIFYSAGLVKKSKAQSFKKFKALCKEMKCNPIEFGELIATDVGIRIAKQQFGIDKLHPSTYLNNQRWTDEHEETNDGRIAPTGKQSAAERIAARNDAKYGQPSGGLGMAEGSGDLRGAVGEGERRNAIAYVEPSIEQAEPIDCQEWHPSDY